MEAIARAEAKLLERKRAIFGGPVDVDAWIGSGEAQETAAAPAPSPPPTTPPPTHAPNTLLLSSIRAFGVPDAAQRASAGLDSATPQLYMSFTVLAGDDDEPSARTTSTLDAANPSWPDALAIPLPAGWRGGYVQVRLWDEGLARPDWVGGSNTLVSADGGEIKSLALRGRASELPGFEASFAYAVTA